MTAAKTKAVDVTAEFEGRLQELSVPFGTQVGQIWRMVKDALGIPDDVEAFPKGWEHPRRMGLSWGEPVHRQVHLVFAPYAYD